MKMKTPVALELLQRLEPTRTRPSSAHRPAGDASRGEGDGTARDLFRKFAHKVSLVVGTPAAFVVALLVLAAWAVSGPVFGFSDTWQLIINTGTTIVTFLMVFLIQSTQNRDANAIHLKLDELIRATSNARDDLVALEQMSDTELESLEKDFERLRGEACRIRREKRESENPPSEKEAAGGPPPRPGQSTAQK